ncbi:MAG TPA: hemerythrin domain-containing protein [Marmoricola sp.]|nr:hemerythrin domain-containing protein [Marmoricola sp.]
MDSNVVDLIMNDHRELERIFDQLMTQPDKRPTLVPVMITLLTAHSRAEESEVYPAAAEAGGEEDVEHSQQEHLEADQLAARVAETDFDSPEFPKALQQLIDGVKHHVDEEESTVLPGMRENMTPERLDELGQAFLRSRQEHLGEMPADTTKAELEQQAANVGVSGASRMSKSELESTLEDQAEL